MKTSVETSVSKLAFETTLVTEAALTVVHKPGRDPRLKLFSSSSEKRFKSNKKRNWQLLKKTPAT